MFVLIVDTDDYEDDTRLQTRLATYKGIQAWGKKRYGIHVSNLAISRAKEKYSLVKTEYRGWTPRSATSPSCVRRRKRRFSKPLSGSD